MRIDLAQRFAAAAAVQDPSLMLRLRAAGTPAPVRGPRRRRDLGAPLIALAVVVALVWANLPLGYTALWEARVLGSDLRTVTGGGPGWGVAISTDTALALGVLTLAGGDRVFLLTLLVVDDVVALLVISFVYSERIDVTALLVAVALLGALLTMRALAARQFRATGTSSWALYVLSIAAGVALWLSASAAALVRRGPSCLRVTAFSAGVGFTVSLLIASRVFEGAALDQARIGILVTALLAPLLAVASKAVLHPATCVAR